MWLGLLIRLWLALLVLLRLRGVRGGTEADLAGLESKGHGDSRETSKIQPWEKAVRGEEERTGFFLPFLYRAEFKLRTKISIIYNHLPALIMTHSGAF